MYIQFVSRVLESHEQLKPNFFVCKTDDNGTEYFTLSYSTKQNNIENKTLDLKRNFVEVRRQPKTHWYLKKSIKKHLKGLAIFNKKRCLICYERYQNITCTTDSPK